MNHQFYWELLCAMRRLGDVMATALHPVCTQHGITPMQLRLLLSLYYDGPQTASTLAENNCMAHGNSSALCKRLAQQGYILRQRPPQDERRVLISLSPAGRQLLEACGQELATAFDEPEARLPAQDRREILHGLTLLTNFLQTARPAAGETPQHTKETME